MSCEICGGKLVLMVGFYPFSSKVVGQISVPNVKYTKCQNCHDILIDFDQSVIMTEYIKEQERKAITSIPIRDFISLNQAADLLGVTKQAFSKNERIKRGFVYSVETDGRVLYYRKSVEEFKKSGDGRVRVSPQTKETIKEEYVRAVTAKYTSKSQHYSLTSIYSLPETSYKSCIPSKKTKSNYFTH